MPTFLVGFSIKCRDSRELPLKNDESLLKHGRFFCNSRCSPRRAKHRTLYDEFCIENDELKMVNFASKMMRTYFKWRVFGKRRMLFFGTVVHHRHWDQRLLQQRGNPSSAYQVANFDWNGRIFSTVFCWINSQTPPPAPPRSKWFPGRCLKWKIACALFAIRWAQEADLWTHGYWGFDWADSYAQVGEVYPNATIRSDLRWFLVDFLLMLCWFSVDF